MTGNYIWFSAAEKTCSMVNRVGPFTCVSYLVQRFPELRLDDELKVAVVDRESAVVVDTKDGGDVHQAEVEVHGESDVAGHLERKRRGVHVELHVDVDDLGDKVVNA